MESQKFSSAVKVIGSLVLIAIGAFLIYAFFLGGGDNEVDASVLILKDEPIAWDGSSCRGTGDLSSLRPGARIIIFLGDGQKTSELQQGQRTPEGNCRMKFDLEGVTTGNMRFQVGTLSTSGMVSERPGNNDKWVTIEFHP